jgi:hypothetical protein
MMSEKMVGAGVGVDQGAEVGAGTLSATEVEHRVGAGADRAHRVTPGLGTFRPGVLVHGRSPTLARVQDHSAHNPNRQNGTSLGVEAFHLIAWRSDRHLCMVSRVCEHPQRLSVLPSL